MNLKNMVREWAERSKNHRFDGSVIVHPAFLNELIKVNEAGLRQAIAKKIQAEHLKCWAFTDCTHEKDIAIVWGTK